ncbi:MAG: glycosyltransferase family 4 protein [Ginsengibacter sp.]
MNERNNNTEILVLPSWYPSEVEKFAGDFIQRHIEAIALYCHQFVIHVVKDEHAKITKNVVSFATIKNNFTEQIIYYHIKKTGFGLLDKLLSNRKYNRVYKNAIKTYVKNSGKPALVHVHVAMKAGMMAVWLKRKYSIPYILSEHWSGYLLVSDLKFIDYNIAFKIWTKRVFAKASAVTVVSDYLGKEIQRLFPSVKYSVIPNVVNSEIFYPVEKRPSDTALFIHASTMNYEKNVEGILKAFNIVKKTNPHFLLHLYGAQNESINKWISSFQLNENVVCYGEVSQKELASAMQQSDALIMNSRFETFGCVVIEANACGVPVIVSDIPVSHELITENVNGVFAAENNPEKLSEVILSFLDKRNSFNQLEIASTAEKYSYKNVGRQFYELYQSVFAE